LPKEDYEEALEGLFPKLSLETTPFSYRQGPGMPGGPDPQGTTSLSASLALSQALPTGGNLSLSAGDTLSLSGPLDSSTDLATRAPQLSVNLFQPLTLNDRILDTRFLTASQRLALGSYDLAFLARIQEGNSQYLKALETFGQWRVLLRQGEILQGQLDIWNQRVEQGRIALDQGQISLSEYLNRELEREKVGQSYLQTRLALFNTRAELENTWGMSPDPEKVPGFEEQLLLIEQRVFPENPELLNNFGVKILELQGEILEKSSILEGLENSSRLNINAFLQPAYPTGPPVLQRSMEDAWSDLFTSESNLSWGFSLGYSLDLDIFSKQGREREKQEAVLGQNLKNRERLLKNLEAVYQTFLEQQRILLEEYEIQKRNLELVLRDLGNQRAREAAGQLDGLTLRQFELQAMSARQEVLRVAWELVLLDYRVKDFLGKSLLETF